MRNLLVRGHRLIRNKGGAVVGQCECGATSPGLLSTFGREQWHRDHKLEIRGRS
jgi:hypothetical protein